MRSVIALCPPHFQRVLLFLGATMQFKESICKSPLDCRAKNDSENWSTESRRHFSRSLHAWKSKIQTWVIRRPISEIWSLPRCHIPTSYFPCRSPMLNLQPRASRIAIRGFTHHWWTDTRSPKGIHIALVIYRSANAEKIRIIRTEDDLSIWPSETGGRRERRRGSVY